MTNALASWTSFGSGVYNLGFFAMARNEETTLRFLEWWEQRLTIIA